ncbi:hypothetical protein SBOR_8903 [Sclerotinia borealis F-4128]|uniref:Uncharacterized protein n=1 Tax=Sclerotinia borealis (strain F-4128) TaxID=1432307 RepID=W9C741_SCLBF|nr:hypothetical protein SBOR_8903 [Sclerotinia borealis F-4128]
MCTTYFSTYVNCHHRPFRQTRCALYAQDRRTCTVEVEVRIDRGLVCPICLENIVWVRSNGEWEIIETPEGDLAKDDWEKVERVGYDWQNDNRINHTKFDVKGNKPAATNATTSVSKKMTERLGCHPTITWFAIDPTSLLTPSFFRNKVRRKADLHYKIQADTFEFSMILGGYHDQEEVLPKKKTKLSGHAMFSVRGCRPHECHFFIMGDTGLDFGAFIHEIGRNVFKYEPAPPVKIGNAVPVPVPCIVRFPNADVVKLGNVLENVVGDVLERVGGSVVRITGGMFCVKDVGAEVIVWMDEMDGMIVVDDEIMLAMLTVLVIPSESDDEEFELQLSLELELELELDDDAVELKVSLELEFCDEYLKMEMLLGEEDPLEPSGVGLHEPDVS